MKKKEYSSYYTSNLIKDKIVSFKQSIFGVDSFLDYLTIIHDASGKIENIKIPDFYIKKKMKLKNGASLGVPFPELWRHVGVGTQLHQLWAFDGKILIFLINLDKQNLSFIEETSILKYDIRSQKWMEVVGKHHPISFHFSDGKYLYELKRLPIEKDYQYELIAYKGKYSN